MQMKRSVDCPVDGAPTPILGDPCFEEQLPGGMLARTYLHFTKRFCDDLLNCSNDAHRFDGKCHDRGIFRRIRIPLFCRCFNRAV